MKARERRLRWLSEAASATLDIGRIEHFVGGASQARVAYDSNVHDSESFVRTCFDLDAAFLSTRIESKSASP